MSEEPYDGPGTPEDLPLYRENDVFHLLSQHRKRAIILALAMSPWGHVHLRQLSEIVSILETDAERTLLSTRKITNTRTNLKRSHLPPLIDAGIVDWRSDQEDVLIPGPGFGSAVQTLYAGGYSLGHSPRKQ